MYPAIFQFMKFMTILVTEGTRSGAVEFHSHCRNSVRFCDFLGPGISSKFAKPSTANCTIYCNTFSKAAAGSLIFLSHMDVSKNRGKTSKMDGLFHGKPY